jgi:ABC-type Fe3+/spermidine/putrescine transport system ATPase subunit
MMSLELNGITKTLGGFIVRADFTVADGETLVLAGSSGCGKTSTLNLIAGLLRPDAGTITLHKRRIDTLPPWKRNISVVFQEAALFPHINVGKNIGYGLMLRRTSAKEREKTVDAMLDLVRLTGYGKRSVENLSGGERQRVALARALAINPDALLLDEPFSSLDIPLRRQLQAELLEIRASGQAALSRAPWIFVTHDPDEAAALGARTIHMG